MRRALLLAALLALVAAPGALARGISSNWAGWVVVSPNHTRKFTAVSGSWRVPTVNCEGSAAQSASAYWIGLGGDSERAPGLEQIGTDSDCEHGHPMYYAWYELIPAESVPLRLRIEPGDLISAFTSVRGHRVMLRITDVTRRRHILIHRYAPSVDTSSAEWIVEAPLSCTRPGSCAATRLANFGSVDFLSAHATVGRRTASIGWRRWRSSSIELEQAPVRDASGNIVISADPTPHPTRRGGFIVYWHSHPAPVEARLN